MFHREAEIVLYAVYDHATTLIKVDQKSEYIRIHDKLFAVWNQYMTNCVQYGMVHVIVWSVRLLASMMLC